MLKDIVVEGYKKVNEEERADHPKKEAFYVSDSEKCTRALCYELTDVPKTEAESFESLARMQLGKDVERTIVKRVDTMGKLVDTQTRIDFTPEGMTRAIHGYTDLIFQGDKKRHVGEIKSYYGPYQTNELRQGIPKTSYVKQLGIYIWALHGMVKDLEPTGSLLMMSRDDSTIFEFTVSVTNDSISYKKAGDHPWTIAGNIHNIVDRFKAVEEFLDRGQITPPEFEYKYTPKRVNEDFKDYIKKQLTTNVDKGTINRRLSSKKTSFKKKHLSHDLDGFWNGVVCGAWQCKYCSHKTHCLKEQGIKQGYSMDELGAIREVIDKIEKV